MNNSGVWLYCDQMYLLCSPTRQKLRIFLGPILEAQVTPTATYIDSEAYGLPTEDAWVTPPHHYRTGIHVDWVIEFSLGASGDRNDLLESPFKLYPYHC